MRSSLPRFVLLIATACGADAMEQPPDPAEVGLNDVSILLPLPADPADPALLRFDTPANGGPLFSTADFALTAFGDDEAAQRAYETWRIVSVRIDPCFPDLALLATNPSSCRRQLRLVAQPIFVEEFTGVNADDAGIHLLFDLSAADFEAMATRWLALGTDETARPDLPLGVHPTIVAEGIGGATATRLRDLITTYAGPATLSQFTFMEGSGSVSWTFGGVRVRDGQRHPIAIPGVDLGSENAGLTQVTTAGPNGIFVILPQTATTAILAPLAGVFVGGAIGGGDVELQADEATIARGLTETFRIEDPRALNPDTVDCASCHISGRARSHAESLGAVSAGLPRFDDDLFDLSLDMETPATPTQQRAFGYNLAEAVWNERTINESALIAHYFMDHLAQ